MKKNIYFSLFFICLQINLLQAQSFSIPFSSYAVPGVAASNTINKNVPITNSGTPDLDVIVEKTINNLAPMHHSKFCFGIACYDTAATASSVITFTGGSTQFLIADLETGNTPGISCVTYRIKDVNNTSDFAEVEICYNVTLTGINSINGASSVSVPSPNPADKFTALTYNLNGNIDDYAISIFNILGNKIQENKMITKNGVLLLSTADLISGVYFYSLTEGNKVLSTNKLIVSHKN